MMFWQRVRPTIEAQWVAQLEVGEPSEPTLRLAEQLRKTPPVAPPLPKAFQTELRNRLLDQHPARRQPLRLVMRLAWVAFTVMLLVGGIAIARAGLRYPVMQLVTTPPLASLAQTTMTADQATVIYDRAQLEWVENGKQVNAIGESWYMIDGKHSRYQLTSTAGDLLSFYQDDGRNVWLPPDGPFEQFDQPVLVLYRQTFPKERHLIQLWPDAATLLVNKAPVLRMTWPILIYTMRARQASCQDMFCVLGMTTAWQCEEQQCTFLDLDHERTLRFVQIDEEVAAERRVGRFELSSSADSAARLRLTIDLDNFTLVAFEEERQDVAIRFQHLETKTFSRDELSTDFFRIVPFGLTVQPRPTEPGEPTFQLDEVQVEVLSASPKAGAISQPTTITLQLRYAISPSVETIIFYADLQPVGVDSWAMPPGFHHTIKPAAPTGLFTVTIPVLPEQLRPGFWRFNVTARGDKPEAYIVLDGGNRYAWCIACMENGERITVDRIYRAGSKERILVSVAGRTVLPDDFCLQTQLYADGKPVPWWPQAECAAVRERRWKVVVPLYKTGAPGKLTPGVTYSLRAWQRDAPEVEAVQEFADLADKIN